MYYNRDLKKEKKDMEREKGKDKWQEALITALREVPPGQSPNRRICFQCRQADHFRRECPQQKPPLSGKSLKGTLLEPPTQ
jgi:hypothetical protein